MEKIDKQLADKSVYPSDDVLSEVLGRSISVIQETSFNFL